MARDVGAWVIVQSFLQDVIDYVNKAQAAIKARERAQQEQRAQETAAANEKQVKAESAEQRKNGISLQEHNDQMTAEQPRQGTVGVSAQAQVDLSTVPPAAAGSAQGAFTVMRFPNGEVAAFVTKGYLQTADGREEKSGASSNGEQPQIHALGDASVGVSLVASNAESPDQYAGWGWTQTLGLGPLVVQRTTAPPDFEHVELGWSPRWGNFGTPFNYSEYATMTERVPFANPQGGAAPAANAPAPKVTERAP